MLFRSNHEVRALAEATEKFAISNEVLGKNIDQCNMELGEVGVHEAALHRQADEEGVSLENVSDMSHIGEGLFPFI